MNPLLLYVMQLCIVSGILYGYYHFFLRNKRFHQYNRFYLLLAALTSLSIPFINIPVYFTQTEHDTSRILQMLSLLSATGEEVVITGKQGMNSWFSWENTSYLLYALIVFFLLGKLTVAIIKIRKVINKHNVEKLGVIQFVNTDEPDAPFSFFNWLFWSKKIDVTSKEGKQIFRHELFHINHKHSHDVIFFEILTAICWFNPFFHLMKKETRTIHEFLADKFAAHETDKWSYAEMLVKQAIYAKQTLANPFFQPQIKRRIAMITSSTKPGYQYLRKILVLPVAVLVITLFAFTYKEKKNTTEDLVLTAMNSIQPVDTVPAQPTITIKANKITVSPRDSGKKETTLYLINNVRYTPDQLTERFGNAGIEAKEVIVHPAGSPEAQHIAGKGSQQGVVILKEVKETTAKENVVSLKLRGTDNQLQQPLYIVDGKIMGKNNETLKSLKPSQIESISVLKDASATSLYGEDGKDGVILITTKTKEVKRIELQIEEIHEGAEGMPSFKGGATAWRKFLERNLDAQTPAKNNAPAGSYTVIMQFVVDENGYVSNIKSLTNHGYGLEEEATRIIRLSPRWEPAVQNGKKVAASRKQPITFVTMKDNSWLKEVEVAGRPTLEGTMTELQVDISEKPLAMKEVVATGYPSKKDANLQEVTVVGYLAKKNEPLSLQEEAASLAVTYPNPAGNTTTVSLKASKKDNGIIRVTDMNGTVHTTQKIAIAKGTNNYTVNTGNLSKGNYIISIVTEDKKSLKAIKLIKN